MRKYTQAELKNMAAEGFAKDITWFDRREVLKIWSNGNTEKIGYSSGIYGINGGLISDRDTGELYVITARNSNLLTIF